MSQNKLKQVTFLTKYYQIFIVYEGKDGVGDFWIQSDNGDEFHAGDKFPTIEQIDKFRDEVIKY